ncbi:hypothetical protein BgiMline_017225, partial [Biomphalaria glabrata]
VVCDSRLDLVICQSVKLFSETTMTNRLKVLPTQSNGQTIDWSLQPQSEQTGQKHEQLVGVSCLIGGLN